MEIVITHLNQAQEIVRNAIVNCSESVGAIPVVPRTEHSIPGGGVMPATESSGGGTGSTMPEVVPIPVDLPTLPSEHIPDTFPLQTWTISADVNARFNKVLDLGVEAEFELVQLSDGNYQLIVASGSSAGFEIPFDKLGIDIAVGGGNVNGFTLDLTPNELALLSQTLPIPEDALAYGTDPSLANLGFDNISAVSTSHNLTAAIANIDVPLSTDVIDRLTDFDIPDNVSVDGEVGSGYEVRRGNNGAWEVVKKIDVSGGFDIQTDSESPGGFWGSALDTTSIIDLDNITTEGTKVDLSYEMVYNTESQEFYTVVTQETTSFEGSGTQAGFDIPILDEVVGTPNHSVLEGTEGTFNTTTVQTIIDGDGTIVSEQTSTSQGIFDNGQSDLVLSDSEINSTYEGHTIPETNNGD